MTAALVVLLAPSPRFTGKGSAVTPEAVLEMAHLLHINISPTHPEPEYSMLWLAVEAVRPRPISPSPPARASPPRDLPVTSP